jgi:hypothetical protein
MSGLAPEDLAAIEAGFEQLIAQGQVALAEKKKQKKRIESLPPTLRRVVEDKKEYQWHLQPEVKLIVDVCTCINCGAVYESPVGIYLFYKATTQKRIGGATITVAGGTRWKRAAPTDTMPENPIRIIERSPSEKSACHQCWLEKPLGDIAATQPADPNAPAAPVEVDLNTLFPKEETSESVAVAA